MVTAAEGASDYYMGNTVRHEDIGFVNFLFNIGYLARSEDSELLQETF